MTKSDLARRDMLQRIFAGASLAASGFGPALAQNAAPAGAAVERAAQQPDATTQRFVDLYKELSNWSRWGADDEIGTVNLITPAVRKKAAALVKEGICFSMERTTEMVKAVDNPAPIVRDTVHPGKGQPLTANKGGYTADTILMNYHNYMATHMNALSHFLYDLKMYNDRSQDLVTAEDGALKNSIVPFKGGIFTRGVLMDMARHNGVDWLEPGTPIYPADLEAWEKKANVKVGQGDFVIVRTGRWARRDALGPKPLSEGLAGLHMESAKWLHDRGASVLGGDNDEGVKPSLVTLVGEPLHTLCLAAMGMPVFDEMDLEELIGREAEKRKRWSFLVTAAPIAVPGATGSVINPIATF